MTFIKSITSNTLARIKFDQRPNKISNFPIKIYSENNTLFKSRINHNGIILPSPIFLNLSAIHYRFLDKFQKLKKEHQPAPTSKVPRSPCNSSKNLEIVVDVFKVFCTSSLNSFLMIRGFEALR